MAAAEPFRLLVICTGNRARSQMAHGWLQSLGGERVAVSSAGVVPKIVHPLAIRVMAEAVASTSRTTPPTTSTATSANEFDLVLTVCDAAREACPVFPGAKRTMHRAFEDPDYPWMSEEEMADVFRGIRDAIGKFSRELLASELGVAALPQANPVSRSLTPPLRGLPR